MLAECATVVEPSVNFPGSRVGTAQVASVSSQSLPVEYVDVAVIGADVAGLAAALAAARAQPGARVMLYDTANEPPAASDGGVLLSVNGLRALRALDASLYTRLTTELSTSLHESLWFDMENELVRRTSLGLPNLAAPSSSASTSSRSRRRGIAGRQPAPAISSSSHSGPDPSAPPLMVGLHELREALADALPAEVEIFGRHHVSSVEPCPGGGALVHFALSPGGAPVRSVRAKVLVGADGPSSAIKRLQFDSTTEPQLSGRIVWRGRFTVRHRDPDWANVRGHATSSRTWVDLRAPHGAERTASLSPAGPNTFVWTASCPISMLASRGLQQAGGASPYWRCLAMFEDFPQDFFTALRSTAANVVTEYAPSRAPAPAMAASLAAPWQWFSGSAALVGDAVYMMPIDDVSSTATNLALEDAAVLGACTAQHGLSPRALQEYARLRGARVSALLGLPPNAPERLRLRDAPFLAQLAQHTQGIAPGSLSATVMAAVDSAAADTAARTAQPMEEILAMAATEASAGIATMMPLGPRADCGGLEAGSANVAPGGPQPSGPGVDLSRPSGGANRAIPPGFISLPLASPSAVPSGPSSPMFSRPSGARRFGPLPAALAAVMSLLAGTASSSSSRAAAAATLAAANMPSAAAVTAAAISGVDGGQSAESTSTVAVPPYSADSTPNGVWEAVLRSLEFAVADAVAADAGIPEQAPARAYCSMQTPTDVWQALLVAPEMAHDMLVSRPYDAAKSPALVWMALQGVHAPPAATGTATESAPALASRTPTAPDAHLLPRPVLKHKHVSMAAAKAPAPAATLVATPTIAAPTPTTYIDMTPRTTIEVTPQPEQQQQAPTSPQPLATSVTRRRTRGQAAPASGGRAAVDRRSGKARKPAVGARTAVAASKAKAAAKAAATMTMSLSAAAALGGVISAGGGHMPVDMASALHVHGAVAQFWDDLNNLNLSSASLSSIDI